MSALEIILLILGVFTFIAGYVFPEKKEKLNEDQQNAVRDEVKKLTGEELVQARQQLNDSIEESVKYAMERSERSLERLSNEKVMAVNEYADSVLTDIRKNHDEVVFMYDMLSGKQDALKETVKEVDLTSRQAREMAMDAKAAAEDAQQELLAMPGKEPAQENGAVPVPAQETMPPEAPPSPDAREEMPEEPQEILPGEEPFLENATEKRGRGRPKTAKHAHGAGEVQDISALLLGIRKPAGKHRAKPEQPEAQQEKPAGQAPNAGLRENSNSRILELHQRGKSPVSIAKELGLGVGEVQLVIGLYEGRN